jgi:hypothetical protein
MPDEPPVRREAEDGPFRTRHSWDSHIEKQIQNAMAEGAFDNLPHQGKPLPNDENPLAGDMGMAFHVLKNAGFAPPWIETDKEIRLLLERRDVLLARAARDGISDIARRRDRASLEQIVRDANAAILRLNSEAPTYRQHRPPLVLADELARYDEAAGR